MSLEGWAAVGTFIGVVLGGLALLQSQRQSTDEEAAKLRSALRGYRSAFAETVGLLREGSALIDPVWRAADALGERTEHSFDRTAVLALVKDKEMRLGIAVQAWSSSPISAELRASLRELNASRVPVTGRLAFFVPTSDIVNQIIKTEDFPPLFLLTLLDPKIIDKPLREVESRALSGQAARLEVGSFLQGQASTYFAGRYDTALAELDTFVEISTEALADLDARDITRLARRKRSLYPQETTLTREIGARLGEVATYLPAGEERALRRMLPEIGILLGKEGAEQRIAEFIASRQAGESVGV